jgi:hypothetical protein
MQRGLAASLDHHVRIFRDIPLLSPLLQEDETFLTLLETVSLPSPIRVTQLLSDSSLDMTSLSDTLAMARQEQVHLTRKLRSVRESWQERKGDWDGMRRRIDWLEEHDSEERRARGSCAREVHSVVRGFDKLLGGVHRQMYRPKEMD